VRVHAHATPLADAGAARAERAGESGIEVVDQGALNALLERGLALTAPRYI